MSFPYSDLGYQDAGNVVVVTVDTQVNIRLLDSANFQRWRSGGNATGTHVKALRSPVRLKIPHSGHWYVAADLGGASGTFRWGVQVLSLAA